MFYNILFDLYQEKRGGRGGEGSKFKGQGLKFKGKGRLSNLLYPAF